MAVLKQHQEMRIMYRIIILIMFFITAVVSYSRNFVIAGIPEEPNRWAGRNGVIQGIDVDIIDYIMKKMDIKYEIVLVNSSARLIQNSKMKNRPYDMVFTYSFKKERTVSYLCKRVSYRV